MEDRTRIMNITNGDEERGNWETREEAEQWIEDQDCPEMYSIMEEFN